MKADPKRRLLPLLLSGALLSAAPATAQEAHYLPLPEAINRSLAYSPQLKLAAARVKEAGASYDEARERRLPDATLSGSYLRLLQPDVNLKLQLPTSGAGGGTGGGNEPQGESSPEVNSAAYGIFNVSLPVFSGFRIKYGIESAKYLAEAARLNALNDRQAVITNTVAAYSNLFKAAEAVRLVQENLRTAGQRVADYSNLEKNGLLARNDLLKAQLQESNIRLTLLEAQNNYKTAAANMNLMLGMPATDSIVVDTVFSAQADNRSFAEWESAALGGRSDVAALAQQAEAARVGLKATKGGYFPSIALTGGYVAAYVPNVITITNAANVGVGLSYSPSSLWKGRSSIHAAKARIEAVQAQQAQLSDAVRLQTQQAYQNYLLSRNKVGVFNEAVEQATENYRIINNKYNAGLATTTDVLDADVALLQARLNLSTGQADVVTAYYRLQQAAGAAGNSMQQ